MLGNEQIVFDKQIVMKLMWGLDVIIIIINIDVIIINIIMFRI